MESQGLGPPKGNMKGSSFILTLEWNPVLFLTFQLQTDWPRFLGFLLAIIEAHGYVYIVNDMQRVSSNDKTDMITTASLQLKSSKSSLMTRLDFTPKLICRNYPSYSPLEDPDPETPWPADHIKPDISPDHSSVSMKEQPYKGLNSQYCRVPARRGLQQTARALTRHGARDTLVRSQVDQTYSCKRSDTR